MMSRLLMEKVADTRWKKESRGRDDKANTPMGILANAYHSIGQDGIRAKDKKEFKKYLRTKDSYTGETPLEWYAQGRKKLGL